MLKRIKPSKDGFIRSFLNLYLSGYYDYLDNILSKLNLRCLGLNIISQ